MVSYGICSGLFISEISELSIEIGSCYYEIAAYDSNRDGDDPAEGEKMSDREKAKILIDQMPEYKMELVLAYLQGVFDGVSEISNNETIAAFKEIEEGGGYLFSGSTEDLFAKLAED